MARGEFESMSLFYAMVPEFVVKPIAWGKCASVPETYFFISEFHDLDDEVSPNLMIFCARTAELHARSAEIHHQKSWNPPPEGNYGFHVTTHIGTIPKDNRWCDTWEEFFKRAMQRVLDEEERTQGPSNERALLAAQLLEKVIPRLLRPLETGGRLINPALVHGDLKSANVGTDRETNLPVTFDGGAFWGHNECKQYYIPSLLSSRWAITKDNS
jgi:protein-ribulosamine 3-kinase